jgi:hypothetical protein
MLLLVLVLLGVVVHMTLADIGLVSFADFLLLCLSCLLLNFHSH